MAYDRHAPHARKHHAHPAAFARAGAQPSREYLAVHARELAFQSRLRDLRRDHRRGLRGLAKAHRSTANNQINRNARLGKHRSVSMTVGITEVRQAESAIKDLTEPN